MTATRQTTYIYFALILAMGLTGAILGPALPTLAKNTGVSTDTSALFFTAKAFGAMGGAFLIGRTYDSRDGHQVMRFTLLVLFLTLLSIPFISNFPLLLSMILIGGVCEGGIHVGANTLLIRLHREKSAPYINGLHFSFGLGATIAPAILGFSFDLNTGIVLPYICIALPVFILFLILFKSATPEGEPTKKESAPLQTSHKTLALLFGLIFFLYVGAEGTFSGWIYSYGLARNLADPTSAAILTSLFWAGLTLGRLLGILLSRRFTPSQILPFELLAGLGGLAWIGFSGFTFESIAVGTTFFGFAIASIFPMTMAFASNHMKLTGSVTGWFFFGAAAGGMTLPWLVGQYFESIGPEVMLIAAGLALGLGLVVYGVIRFVER